MEWLLSFKPGCLPGSGAPGFQLSNTGSTTMVHSCPASCERPLRQWVTPFARSRIRNIILQSTFKRLLVASDAAYEKDVGSARFLAVLNPGATDELRVGVSVSSPPSAYALWGDRKTYIAQLELFTVYVAMVQLSSLVSGAWTT